MTGRNTKASLAHISALGLLALGAACQSPATTTGPVDDPVPAAAMPLASGPARDLAVSVPAAKIAFVANGRGFRGGYRTHDVRIADGVIDVTPRSYDALGERQITGGTIGLETNLVAIGDEALSIGAVSMKQTAADTVRVNRGALTERVTNREDGIEQAWDFAASPGDGDLRVEVLVAGQTYTGTTAGGLHFKSALGVRYGNGTWIDANGAAYEIPAMWADDRIVLVVPQHIIAESAYPATLDPTVSAELLTDVPAIGSLGTNSRNSDVASDGTGYFVVWNDQRAADRIDNIYGARVTAAGVVTDTTGIKINTATGTQQNPVVAYVGTGYVVAWENVVAVGNSDIAAAFVSSSGVVTQLGTIAGTAANETGAAIAGRGGEALLTWQDGSNVLGAVYSGGAFGAAFTVAGGANVEKEPAVAANPGGDYLVAYTEVVAAGNDDIRGVMVTAAGAPGAAFNIGNQAGNQDTATAGFDGTQFLVAWTTATNILGARVTAVGVLTDTTPATINAGAGSQVNPDVSCNGTSCAVVWEDTRTFATTSRDVFTGLVDTSVTPMTVGPNDVALTTAVRTQTVPAVALAGTQWLTVWTDARDLDVTQIRGSRITSAGAVSDASGLTIVTNYSRRADPAIAQSSSYTDIVFADSLIPDSDIQHVRFQTKQVDKPPKLVTNAGFSQTSPTVAFVGSNFLATWMDTRGADRDIYAATIDQTTGIAGASVPISTATLDQFIPQIASGGSSALIVWQDRRNGATTGFDVYAALVTSAGAVSVADISICQGAGDQTRPSVAFDTVNQVYLVAWSDPNGNGSDIRGARVSAAGALLDASCGVAISGAAGSQLSPDVTYGANQFFLVWEDRRNGDGDVFGARVTANGSINVVDTNGIAIKVLAGSAQSEPAVAYGSAYGGGYVVAWTDARNMATTGLDIWGSRVGTNGLVEAEYNVSQNASDEHAPDVSQGANANAAFNVAYATTRTDLDSERMQFRHITFTTSTNGQPCTTDSQCATGFCSDSVCCDTACGGFYNVRDCQACSTARGAAVNGTCSNIPASANYICRYYAAVPVTCDIAERCDGTGPNCPPDLGQRMGQTCNIPGGGIGTCPANDASGAPHVCQ